MQLTASIAAQRGTEPAKLTKLVRGDLDWIVMKALEKDPARRYETANGLARDIQRHLEGDPVEAGPPSALYRLRKLAGKHRAALVTATAFAAMLVAGTVVSTWQAVRATRAEAVARRDRDAAIAARTAETDARRRAEDAERASRTEAEKARAVNRFLTEDLLSQAEPEYNAADSKVTLLEVLDRAAEKVADRFRDQSGGRGRRAANDCRHLPRPGRFRQERAALARRRRTRAAAIGAGFGRSMGGPGSSRPHPVSPGAVRRSTGFAGQMPGCPGAPARTRSPQDSRRHGKSCFSVPGGRPVRRGHPAA